VGWSRLSEARIGKLDVPLANVPQNGRVQLSAIEYLAQTEGDENGNVSVVEERLIRLKEER
jgi:CRISPR-associated protein (TIGR03984 family)